MNFKRLNDLAKVPTRGSEYAAGYDLYAATSYEIEIKPHTTVKIDTACSIEIPHGLFGAIFPRSGIATKRGLRLANCVAVIDEDYRGSLIVALHNDTDSSQYVHPQERIAQLVFIPYQTVEWEEVDELSETERKSGGFGSSGKF